MAMFLFNVLNEKARQESKSRSERELRAEADCAVEGDESSHRADEMSAAQAVLNWVSAGRAALNAFPRRVADRVSGLRSRAA